LLTPSAFKRVLDNGKRQSGEFFTMVAQANCDATGERPGERLGVTVSRKVSTRAVIRNRIKRQIRESFRHIPDRIEIQGDAPRLDLIVIAKPAAATAQLALLRSRLDADFDKLIRRCRSS
jgi:ribonuclease P protein component